MNSYSISQILVLRMEDRYKMSGKIRTLIPCKNVFCQLGKKFKGKQNSAIKVEKITSACLAFLIFFIYVNFGEGLTQLQNIIIKKRWKNRYQDILLAYTDKEEKQFD